MSKQESWAEIKYRLMFDQPVPRVKCENCHTKPGEEAHHAFFSRDKNNPWVNHEYNMAIVCKKCHDSGKVDSYTFRTKFAVKQIARYGRTKLRQWLDSAPDKTKLIPRYKELRELVGWPKVGQSYKGAGFPGGKDNRFDP